MVSLPSDAQLDLDAPPASRSGRVWGKFGAGLLAFFALVTTGFLILWATAIPLAFGWQPLSIVSGSMEPQIGVGDVVIAEPYANHQLEPGMVIVYEDPVFGGLVSHRIQSVNGDGTLTTKGDANQSADSTPTPIENVVGMGRILVPEVGWPTIWASTKNYLPLAITLAVWFAFLFAARWGVLSRFDPWLYESEQRPNTPPPARPTSRRGRGRHLRKRRSPLRPIIGVGSVLGALTALAIIGTASAAFTATTSNAGNSFAAPILYPPSNLTLSASCAAGNQIGFRASTTTAGQSTSITLAKPSGTVQNDTMLAHIVLRDDVALTAPTGWSLVRRSTSGPFSAIYVKVAGASEPASYTWTSSNVRFAAGMGTWTNVNTTSPIDAHGGQAGNGSSIVAPSITTTVPNTVLVAFWSIRDNRGVTIPGSMSLRWEIASTEAGARSHQVQTTAAGEPFPGTGATGTRTATSPGSENNVGQMVALRPAASGGGGATVSASWTATPSGFASGYRLQRWQGSTMQTEQSITPRTTTTATDTTVTPGQTYAYRLHAFYNTWSSTQITNTVTVPSC